MARLIALLAGVGLVVAATNPVTAAVWRCHTPTGDVWTNQPQGYGDCEEFPGTYYPNAEPPAYPESLLRHPLPNKSCRHPHLRLFMKSAPAPLYPPYYDPYFYSSYGPGVYVYPPWFGFRFGHGPRLGHGGHFGGHRFGGERSFRRGHGRSFGGGQGRSFGGGSSRGTSLVHALNYSAQYLGFQKVRFEDTKAPSGRIRSIQEILRGPAVMNRSPATWPGRVRPSRQVPATVRQAGARRRPTA